MARGSITEEDLAAGIKSVGVLSAVAGPHGQRRDSPFGPSTHAKPALPEKRIDPPPTSAPDAKSVEAAPKAPPGERKALKGRSEGFADYITLPITAHSRGKATLLAAELQRRRTERALRFSANVLFRAAI